MLILDQTHCCHVVRNINRKLRRKIIINGRKHNLKIKLLNSILRLSQIHCHPRRIKINLYKTIVLCHLRSFIIRNINTRWLKNLLNVTGKYHLLYWWHCISKWVNSQYTTIWVERVHIYAWWCVVTLIHINLNKNVTVPNK